VLTVVAGLNFVAIGNALQGNCRPRLGACFLWRVARRFGLHLADRLFKGKALPGDIRVQERVLVRAHMRDGFTRPLVDRLARFIGVCVEPFYGAGYERIVLVHSNA